MPTVTPSTIEMTIEASTSCTVEARALATRAETAWPLRQASPRSHWPMTQAPTPASQVP